jgi:hypothetical protein
MEKHVKPHMKHAFYKWFLHNRKNLIRRLRKKGSRVCKKTVLKTPVE